MTAHICMHCGATWDGKSTYREKPACTGCRGDALVEFGPERLTLHEAQEVLADFDRTIGGGDAAGHIGVISSFYDRGAKARAENAILALYGIETKEEPA